MGRLPDFNYFTFIRSHFGTEFEPLFKNSGITFNTGKDYTFRDWFEMAIQEHLLKMFDYTYTGDQKGDYQALMKLRDYTNKKFQNAALEIFLSLNDFKSEINSLFKEFSAFHSQLNDVLVRYDDELNVVAGVAPKQHPIKAMVKRVSEFEDALK